MYKKAKCVAMLLAGGQGSRLYSLTEHTAKPAVSFGGKYRIIDFTLSNCVNSGIYTVGVLTQYQPLELSEYISGGKPWDLDRMNSGVTLLPPYKRKRGGDFYLGTADAIYQNLGFIDRYCPEYVLVLSGDHIYKMDYGKMLEYHKSGGAACTVAALRVPLSEASRFGIIQTDGEWRITGFEEKPPHPRSDLASMGIYIFSAEVLRGYLERDRSDRNSSRDFGKDVLPRMLSDGVRMLAYPFEGYWKDVGTVDSLWEANMELLGSPPAFDIHDRDRRVFSRSSPRPPHFISRDAEVISSLISEGCEIHGRVESSVLSPGVTVEAGAVVRDSVIMENSYIGRRALVDYAICGPASVMGEASAVRGDREGGHVTVVPEGFVIGDGESYSFFEEVPK